MLKLYKRVICMKENTNPITGVRSAGALLHISSLPGAYGVGTMGKEAREFADFLKDSGFTYWQILPLVQTGQGDSPYQSVYASSGNPFFIDPDILVEKGLVTEREAAENRIKNDGAAHYSEVYEKRFALLRKAFGRFDRTDAAFAAFSAGGFLDYALFMAIRAKYNNAEFRFWEKPLRFHQAEALEKFRAENADEVDFWLFVQFEFYRQWDSLKKYVNGLGIRIIGDIPLYMAYDSADVWANPRLFKLNKNLTRTKVAGVPPDYFSATGQLWGNPVYDWKVHESEGFAWWIERIRLAFSLYDVVRIDHFRGFDRYFEIDADAETAIGGKWKKGPGIALFEAAKAALGELDFIAEDLGSLDTGVYRLMRKTGYPGMKVLQFAFDGNADNPYLPQNIRENSICYTGTHDNDTLVGFLDNLQDWERTNLNAQLVPLLKKAKIPVRISTSRAAAAAMRELALSCKSGVCVLPVQDILLTGGETRMNVPAVSEGNWRYRLKKPMPQKLAPELKKLLEKYARA